MLKNFVSGRQMIATLSKNDFRKKFAGSYFGILWALASPIVTVLVYWFVFQVGLHQSHGPGNVPFFLWMLAGLIPWFYFQEALAGGTASLVEYSYLVKKVVFNIEVLPIVKVVSSLYVHAFFIFLTAVIYALSGKFPGTSFLQVFYYSFCMFALVLSLSYGLSAITVLFRDLQQMVNIALQIGVWVTPIMWDLESVNIPGWLKMIFKLNPMYYIVSGWRDSLIYRAPFWLRRAQTPYFWIFTVLVYLWGTRVFRKLRVHFADVL